MQIENTHNNTPSTTITKKIGKAVYTIQIHFSKTSKDSFNDKVMRIIKHDIAKNAEAS